MSDTTLFKMSRVESLWERLVNAALQKDRTGEAAAAAAGGGPGQGGRDIDDILRAADELQVEDPIIARILCEHACSLAEKLDPNSEDRGLLQFRTGLMSVIKQNTEKRAVGTIDRSQDINRLQGFYQRYREKNNVGTLKEEEKQLRESGAFTDELERKTVERKRVLANLQVLEHVLKHVSKEIFEELNHVYDSDAAMSEGTCIAYNIVPLDAPVRANATTAFPEVQAAVAALKYFPGLPKLPAEFPIPATRNADMLDFLHYIFGFQRDSVCNQREHIVLLLSNEQSRLNSPGETERKLGDDAVSNVFLKSLDNYIKWCDYLCIQHSWSNLESISGEKKLLYLSLYFLIWGEAANIRFLPECLCYIFHHMVREMDEILRQQVARPAASCGSDDGVCVSFLDHVIAPLYEVVSAEAFNNGNGRVPHSAWRNYDDFNEYFWSLQSFELGWPWRTSSSFFQKPIPRRKFEVKTGREKHGGKTSFVEHRTFLHLYHSFHRLWIFLAMTFQALAIVAFNEKSLASRKTLREILSLGPTYVVMKFFKSVLDVIIMYGAYSTTRRLAVIRMFLRFIWLGLASVFISFLYVRALQEDSKPNSDSVMFKLYVILIAIYGGVQLFSSILMRVPTCHNIANKCDGWTLIRFFKWMWRQERHYVGRGMYERTSDYIKYLLFWLVVLSAKFSFAYFLQIEPLVSPTRMIVKHGNYSTLTVASLWAPVVAIYLLDIHIFYTLVSAFLGFLLCVRARLGKIRSLEEIHKQFKKFPGAFIKALHVPITDRTCDPSHEVLDKKNRVEAAHFAPFWNQIIKCLREEDYITDFEMDLLLMPKSSGSRLVQWPLFLLSNKILLATEIAAESKSEEEIVKRIEKDVFMKYAVEEVYYSLERVLITTLEAEGKFWADRIFRDIQDNITMRTVHLDFHLKKLSLVITKVTALLGVLKENETPEHATGATKALQDLYNVILVEILAADMRDQYDTWNLLARARNEGRLFTKLRWPKDPEMKALVKRLYSLLTINDSTAQHVPRNLEARRRLQFFTNSLFMDVPQPKPVHQMLSFSVFTPYCSEVVLYSMSELTNRNEDGISILFYLQKTYPDEWKNFLARIGQDENALEGDLHNERDILELRFWASYRGQTLARTVRGMMYYRKALMLQSYLERKAGRVTDEESTLHGNDPTDAKGFELSPEARAQADLKFTYVVTCQMYGRQKEDQKPEAADIALLMQRNEALRIAYIDVVDTLKEGKSHKEYYSKLVKADISGKDKEVYSIRLPGDPKLGQCKTENQNHAIVFTRGNALQTIDMNQDNYFEEALKMRNLLEEFDQDHGIRPPTILGVREHVFTGSVSSLGSFISNQETSFATLGQRVLAKPLKIRMHYGHSDIFDRVFHITRGGISKASRVINASEDIFAGFNSILRQGNITHHEYIQVGKGRDVGLSQISLLEGKVAGGNGEQVLSRDVYRLGQFLDFFRMMSFYFTTVGLYFCTMLTVLTLYIFLYGKAYLALSGVGATIQERDILVNNTALSAALSAQFLFQIGVFTAVPMFLGFILEQGFLQAIVSFTTMQFQLCTVFFTFSLGTRAHYFGRTLLHGGASVCQQYQATQRGFVVKHVKFSENYRLYARSHFVKGMEVILLLVVYIAYGNDEAGSVSYVLLTVSSCFLAFSWLFAPYLFNPSGFERQKMVEDFKEWRNWLFYRGGGIGVEGAESWEAWWEEELSHIGTLSGRIVETILSLRFFIFQYGIVYKLNLHGSDTSFAVYGWSWAAFAMILVLFKVFALVQKIAVNLRLVLRFIQGLALLVALAGIIVAVVLTELSVTDIFACVLLAFVPTGWGILSIACAWKPVSKRIGVWESVRSLAWLYDAGMGMLIFLPVALFSWFRPSKHV
ncbi:callose synthase 9-like isoform X1 [Raphanus sativus]|uniref:1,3-beta-glucan synthase n=1 Tax=Raphanus sativus TaxID=3726 RepID=A0A9W3BUE7_RAPSA|nr:callose synthase 9-like isoform X1 [Raphanus sativus]